MIGETTEFIVFGEGGLVKHADQGTGDIEYTEARNEAQVFHGRDWADFWAKVPGTLLVFTGDTPAQEMAGSGARRLPGME